MKPDQQQAIARIQLLRGDVASSVKLSWCILDDALKHLKGLPQLQELDLSYTEVTDAGLERLKGLRLRQEGRNSIRRFRPPARIFFQALQDCPFQGRLNFGT
jgi:hypothetical protein